MDDAVVTLRVGVWRDGVARRTARVWRPTLEDVRRATDARGRALSAERLTALVGAAVEIAGESGEAVARELTVGDRAALALHLRSALFGDRLDCRLPCTACGTELELALECSTLAAPGEPTDSPTVSVAVDGRAVSARLPSGEDEEAAGRAAAVDPAGVGLVLLRRLLLGGADDVVAELRDDGLARLQERLEDAIAAADPLAEIALQFVCPSCGEVVSALFEPGPFVLAEIDASVVALEREVDTLARAYGWSEREIVALPPARRARYVELAGAWP